MYERFDISLIVVLAVEQMKGGVTHDGNREIFEYGFTFVNVRGRGA